MDNFNFANVKAIMHHFGMSYGDGNGTAPSEAELRAVARRNLVNVTEGGDVISTSGRFRAERWDDGTLVLMWVGEEWEAVAEEVG